MCGLSGVWEPAGAPRARLEAGARAMADALAHRGPDDAGVWCDPAAGLALGHRRLAVLDLSAEGRQPLATPDGRHVLVYNGEVYNFAELGAELAAEGVRFRSRCDAEVVLHALARWGVERALARFVGMFAFALWDARERELVLARDRLGIKPLHYGHGRGGELLFGSELKALVRHPAFAPELDRDALALYFRHAWIPAPHTIWRGVRKLPPGTYARLRAPDAIELVRYWDLRAIARAGAAEPLRIAEEEAADELERVLGLAVRARLVSDVPLGAFLSGGVDSSTVVALARESGPVRTFAIGFAEADWDESLHARAVARHLGTDHTELVLSGDEARAVVPELPVHWDEPFGDSSAVPTLLVSRLARAHVTVALSGDGGDELFGGYPRYAKALRLERSLGGVPRALRGRLAGVLAGLAPAAGEALDPPRGALGRLGLAAGRGGFRAQRLSELLRARDQGTLYRSLVSHWREPELLVRGARPLATAHADPGLARELPHPLDRMLLLDAVTYLPDDILCKVDRASMAHGLEARVPLLDHRVVELVWRLPREIRVGRPGGKALLKRVLARRVPRALFERPKMGFGAPIGRWMRGPLRAWCEELLSPARLAADGVLAPAAVRRRWEEHAAGRRDWTGPLWDVLAFQAWRERWLPRGAGLGIPTGRP